MRPKKDLTQGSIPKSIFALSLPILGGMIVQNLFILVDTFFVAKLGPAAIAAVAAAAPIFFVIIALITGLNVGVSALIAKAVGSKNYEKVNEIAENGLILAIAVSIGLTILGLLSISTLVDFLGVTGDVAGFMKGYLNILYIGNIAFFLGHVANGMLYGEGDTSTPMKGFVLSLVLNIILDPLMIFGIGFFPEWGVTGAAVATIVARAVGTIYVFWHLFRGKALVKLAFRKLAYSAATIKEILAIGMPTSASQLGVSGGLFMLNKLVTIFGVSALAGFGIAFRIEGLVIMPAVAFGIVALAMVGQNYGAKILKRVRRSSHIAALFAFAITGVIGIALFFWSHYLIELFTKDPAVVEQAITYFKIVGFSYGFLGLRFVAASSFQALGKAMNSFITIIVHFSIMLGVAYLLAFDTSAGINGIWIGIAVSNALIGVASTAWFWSVIEKMEKIEIRPGEAIVQDD